MTDQARFDDLLRRAQHSADHLEMRDLYMPSDPDYQAWRAGRALTLPGDDWKPWLDLVRETTGRGVPIRRARIVSEPVSDFIRFEHEITVHNVGAGEQVRWLPRRQATDIALPGNDFWLIDGSLVLVNHLDGEGEWPPDGGEEVTTDAKVVELCRVAFETVWTRATPHEDYQPT